MDDFILLLIIGSSWCWGVFTLFHEGYILEKLGDWIRNETEDSPPKYVGSWISKPLFDCPPCQGSIHGLFIGVLYYGMDLKVILYMMCLCGLNFIIKSIIFPEYE